MSLQKKTEKVSLQKGNVKNKHIRAGQKKKLEGEKKKFPPKPKEQTKKKS